MQVARVSYCDLCVYNADLDLKVVRVFYDEIFCCDIISMTELSLCY